MKTDQEKQFEAWFQAQPFYVQEVYKHGETLFIKDCGNYKHAAVRTAFAAWSQSDYRVKHLKGMLASHKLVMAGLNESAELAIQMIDDLLKLRARPEYKDMDICMHLRAVRAAISAGKKQ